jgi:predicted O-methyltransferase YrrM
MGDIMIKEAIRVGSRDPISVGMYVLLGKDNALNYQLYELVKWLKFETKDIREYLNLLAHSQKFNDSINDKIKDINYGQIAFPELLYVLVRLVKPNVIVETGVSAGISSAYMLQALDDNERGKLYSIDYPNYAIQEAKPVPQTGFAVPQYLRHRWSLMEGKSSDVLPILNRNLDGIDIFIHDSEHSYDNMKFEYEEVWDNIEYGGLLISHDINDNKAFREFALKWKHEYREVYFTGLGIIKK